MSSRSALAFSVISVCIAVGCGGNTPEANEPSPGSEAVRRLKTRASADFDCSPDWVKTRTLDDRTKVAEGCGQKGTYIYICNKCSDVAAAMLMNVTVLEDCDCTWALDSMRRTAERSVADEPTASTAKRSSWYRAPTEKLEGGAFDRGSAAAALGSIRFERCRMPNGPFGSGHVTVVFEGDGSASSAMIDDGVFAGTPVGDCVERETSRIRIRPFDGPMVKVGKSFVIP